MTCSRVPRRSEGQHEGHTKGSTAMFERDSGISSSSIESESRETPSIAGGIEQRTALHKSQRLLDLAN